MTKIEMAEIMAVITAAYPKFYDKQTNTDKLAAMRLWYRHFGNVSFDIMLQAVDAVIASNKFPPAIAEINEKLDLICGNADNEMSELEAWALVSRAIRNSAYNYNSEFEKLPSIVQKIIGSPYQLREWAFMDETQVQSVIASNFQRSYRAETAKEKQLAYLPEQRQRRLQERMKCIGE